jgi:hypothetical protein
VGSPQPPDRAAALGTAQTLVNALDRMEKRLAEVNESSEKRDADLKRYGRHNRLAIIIDVLLTVVTTVAVVFAVHATNTADQTQQASATSCVAGNSLRATLDEVFDHVFTAVKPPPQDTPAEKAMADRKLQQLEAYYHAKFKGRACASLYGVAPASSGAPAKGATHGG